MAEWVDVLWGKTPRELLLNVSNNDLLTSRYTLSLSRLMPKDRYTNVIKSHCK